MSQLPLLTLTNQAREISSFEICFVTKTNVVCQTFLSCHCGFSFSSLGPRRAIRARKTLIDEKMCVCEREKHCKTEKHCDILMYCSNVGESGTRIGRATHSYARCTRATLVPLVTLLTPLSRHAKVAYATSRTREAGKLTYRVALTVTMIS